MYKIHSNIKIILKGGQFYEKGRKKRGVWDIIEESIRKLYPSLNYLFYQKPLHIAFV